MYSLCEIGEGGICHRLKALRDLILSILWRYPIFHTSEPSRFIGTRPHSEPKSSKTLLTLSRRRVVLPCSNSCTKRSPTPAFSERSTCVSLYFLRISFTYCAMIVLATILYQLLEVPHSEYEGVSKYAPSLVLHKAPTFSSQGFFISQSFCNFSHTFALTYATKRCFFRKESMRTLRKTPRSYCQCRC